MAQIGDILGIAETIRETTNQIRGIRRDWREAAARYLRVVAGCLVEIRTELAQGNSPHLLCKKLETYSNRMPKTVTRILKDEHAEKLKRALMTAHHKRSEFMQATASGGSGDPALLTVIDEVAGELEASADIIEAD